MSDVIEKAVGFMLAIAGDASHGYDQGSRWGPDYDCSSLVITAFEQAGVPVKSKGGATYTGNMKKAFLAHGFCDVTASCNLTTGAGMARGDVLLNEKKHTAVCLGGYRLVHARANESGKALGGKTGDQTGGEIRTQAYYNSPWDCVLRFASEKVIVNSEEVLCRSATDLNGAAARTCSVSLPELARGDKGAAVKALQTLLVLRGCSVGSYGADGSFGPATLTAVRQFQRERKLLVDGEVGVKTWTKLISL